jgi:hypothetical protein
MMGHAIMHVKVAGETWEFEQLASVSNALFQLCSRVPVGA